MEGKHKSVEGNSYFSLREFVTEMFLLVNMLCVLALNRVKGDNIMLGKPSKQSTTFNAYDSWNANDGSDTTISVTKYTDQQPYWQGDLQGFYRILNITVINDHYSFTQSTFLGASVLDVTVPGSDVITCGELQDDNSYWLQSFNCNFSQPVRFIRIWHAGQGSNTLILSEVAVQGVKEQISEINYEQTESQKLSTPKASFTFSLTAECASACFNTQPCFAFSFRQGGQLNCLLATDESVTSDTDWVTYTINSTDEMVTCN